MQTTARTGRSALAADLHALLIHLVKASTLDALTRLGGVDLSLTQVRLLCVLDGAPADELPLAGVAERVQVSLPAASRAVDGLTLRGLVERREDRDDRRAKRVRILEDGRAVPAALHEARIEAIRDFARSLSDEQADALARALAPIVPRPPETQ